MDFFVYTNLFFEFVSERDNNRDIDDDHDNNYNIDIERTCDDALDVDRIDNRGFDW